MSANNDLGRIFSAVFVERTNMRDITLCHPRLQRLAGAWMKACVTQGIAVTIGETFRTVAEQDALYAQGRTKPGKKGNQCTGQQLQFTASVGNRL